MAEPVSELTRHTCSGSYPTNAPPCDPSFILPSVFNERQEAFAIHRNWVRILLQSEDQCDKHFHRQARAHLLGSPGVSAYAGAPLPPWATGLSLSLYLDPPSSPRAWSGPSRVRTQTTPQCSTPGCSLPDRHRGIHNMRVATRLRSGALSPQRRKSCRRDSPEPSASTRSSCPPSSILTRTAPCSPCPSSPLPLLPAEILAASTLSLIANPPPTCCLNPTALSSLLHLCNLLLAVTPPHRSSLVDAFNNILSSLS